MRPEDTEDTEAATLSGLAPEDEQSASRNSVLISRNVRIRGRRTSIRIEPAIWKRVTEICEREFCTPHDVCSFAAYRRPPLGSLASELRLVVLDYFRAATTEDGHRKAGHGQGLFMAQQQERLEMLAERARLRRESAETDMQEMWGKKRE